MPTVNWADVHENSNSNMETQQTKLRQCVNCNWWVRVQLGLGTCHHHAPSGAIPIVPLPPEAAAVNIAFKTGKAAWPVTASEEFCGDFQERLGLVEDTHPKLALQ